MNLRLARTADYPLLVSMLILIGMGTLLILSASGSRAESVDFTFFNRQLLAAMVGVFGFLGMAYLDYHRLGETAPALYLLTLLLLLGVLFTGYSAYGAQRWFNFGPVSIQPSELAKLLVGISLARFLFQNPVTTLSKMMWPVVLVGIPFLLIYRQPDLGTALVLVALLLGMLIWNGFPLPLFAFILSPAISVFLSRNLYLWIPYLIVLFILISRSRMAFWDKFIILFANLVIGLGAPYLWGGLKEYQQQRLLTFLNPGQDPLGAGYHRLQSMIAIGSGGWLGKGIFHGTQTQLKFIPLQTSDFIFSVVGEELGLLGAALAILLFAIIIYRGIKIAVEAADPFGSYLAGGIVTVMIFHLLINLGMTMGLLPVVGIPLPFMSYGGTSLVTNMMAVGILESISMRRRKLFF